MSIQIPRHNVARCPHQRTAPDAINSEHSLQTTTSQTTQSQPRTESREDVITFSGTLPQIHPLFTSQLRLQRCPEDPAAVSGLRENQNWYSAVPDLVDGCPGVPKETYPEERRVALTPTAVRQLTKEGFHVSVASGAGIKAMFSVSRRHLCTLNRPLSRMRNIAKLERRSLIKRKLLDRTWSSKSGRQTSKRKSHL